MDVTLGQIDTESIIVLVVFLVSMFAFMRYFLGEIQTLVKMQLEYNKDKNDHMERIAANFAEVTRDSTSKITAMHENIRIITQRGENSTTLTTAALNNNTKQLQQIFSKLEKKYEDYR